MTLVSLITLPPGSRFRTESGREGTYLYGTECGARVKYGEPVKKTITRGVGEQQRTFEVTQEASVTVISANTQVTLLGLDDDEETELYKQCQRAEAYSD